MMIFTPHGQEGRPVPETDEPEEAPTRIWSNPVAWAIALFNFVHVGFESAFNSGIVLQMQFLKFFDRRGSVRPSYTFAPGIGYRLV